MKKLVVDKKLKEVNFATFKDLDSKTEEIVLPEGLKTIKSETFYDNILKALFCQNHLKLLKPMHFGDWMDLKKSNYLPKLKRLKKKPFATALI